jgi:hypothetical protein
MGEHGLGVKVDRDMEWQGERVCQKIFGGVMKGRWQLTSPLSDKDAFLAAKEAMIKFPKCG